MFPLTTVLVWSLLLSAGPAFSQFISPPTDLISAYSHPTTKYQVRYKEVPPGICEQRDDIKSISGYVDISADEHIFFWFFEARNKDPTTAPLTVWINGGPGASSMIGLFQEIGPCSINAAGDLVDNPYSWTNASNILFIDQPVQSGFSYSTTTPGYISPDNGSVIVVQDGSCPSDTVTKSTCGTYSNPNDNAGIPVSTEKAAASFYATLQGFLGAFPQYARKEFHFATESYGGHYGPIFAEYIQSQNSKQGAQTNNISVSALTIVNGWIDPITQYAAYYNFTVSPGNTYDYNPYNDTEASALYSYVYGSGGCVDQLESCASTGSNSVCSAADTYCLRYVENFYDTVTGRDENDIRQLQPDPYPPQSYIEYLSKPSVQAAIGAYVNYTEQSLAVALAFSSTGDDGRTSGTTTDLLDLANRGITVTLIYGDADYNSNWLGGEAVYNSILASNSSSLPGYVNIRTGDSKVHGQVKQADRFAFARIYNSGHEVPYYQPLTALSIFERATAGVDIATGTKRTRLNGGFMTPGGLTSTFREGSKSVSQTMQKVAGGTGRVLNAIHGGLDLVSVNATNGEGSGSGGAGGLANPELKEKMKQLVHIQKRRRRSLLGGWGTR